MLTTYLQGMEISEENHNNFERNTFREHSSKSRM